MAQTFIFNPGHFFVRYPDGERSKLMPFWIALDYRKIFGGKLKFQWSV
jgi:hypothetical protein